MAAETAFIIPEILARLLDATPDRTRPSHTTRRKKRFGERVLPFRDADGIRLALVAVKRRRSNPRLVQRRRAGRACVCAAFRGVTLMVGADEPTAEVLTATFGFQAQGREGHVVPLPGRRRQTWHGGGRAPRRKVFLAGRQGHRFPCTM